MIPYVRYVRMQCLKNLEGKEEQEDPVDLLWEGCMSDEMCTQLKTLLRAVSLDEKWYQCLTVLLARFNPTIETDASAEIFGLDTMISYNLESILRFLLDSSKCYMTNILKTRVDASHLHSVCDTYFVTMTCSLREFDTQFCTALHSLHKYDSDASTNWSSNVANAIRTFRKAVYDCG